MCRVSCVGGVPPSHSLGAWCTVLWGDDVVWGRQSIHMVPPCPLPRALGSCLWVPFAMSGGLCVVSLLFFPSGMGSFSPSFPECCLSVGLVIIPGWQVLWVRVAVVSLSPRGAESGSLLLFPVVSVQSADVLCLFIPRFLLGIFCSWGRCHGPCSSVAPSPV